MKFKHPRIIILLLLGLTAAGRSSADRISLLSEKNGELVVEVSFDSTSPGDRRVTEPLPYSPGLPEPHYKNFFVAVPRNVNVQVQVLGGSFVDNSNLPPMSSRAGIDAAKARKLLPAQGFFPGKVVEISKPYYFRRIPVVAVYCYSSQVDYRKGISRAWSSYKLRITFPPIQQRGPSARPDPFVSELVINKNYIPAASGLYEAPAVGMGVPDPHFDLSPNWVKIQVTQRGMYAIAGTDLFAIGDSLAGIDPSSFRLFTAGGMAQSFSFADTAGMWRVGKWMHECAIMVHDGGDGSFDPQDSLFFYGIGSKDWLNYYKPDKPDTEYYDNPYATANVYFLTWNGAFPGTPARMASVGAGPSASPYKIAFGERLFLEKDLVKKFDFGGDGWLWLDIASKTIPNEQKLLPVFQVQDLAPTQSQTFRTRALADYCGNACAKDTTFNPNEHHIIYRMNGSTVTEMVWSQSGAPSRYEDGYPVVASGHFLQEGDNRLSLLIPREPSLNPKDFMYFDSYSIFYQRYLRAVDDGLGFSIDDTTASVNLEVNGFSQAGSLYLFDVTDQFNPMCAAGMDIIPGPSSTRSARFSSSFTGRGRHFWICSQGKFKKPASMRKYSPKDLRNVTASPNMLIVYYNDFRAAAERLRNYRMFKLPYFPAPDIGAVDQVDVFDNFSGGLHDPMAIRNYCKFLYDNFTNGSGTPELGYLLLFGDANSDYKNLASSQPDFVTTNLVLDPTQGKKEAYATDDRFVLMDSSDEIYGWALPDVAVGRLPAATVNEAESITDKIINYESNNEFGTWRNRVVLVADDEISTNTNFDDIFTIQSENLADFYVPSYLDIFKIYLTEFPAVGSIKPASRRTMLEQWNLGAVLINFIGHGSSQQMADEFVFKDSDVGLLNNGTKLPFLFTLSCTIGDYDNSNTRSLAERLLLRVNGGVIGVVAASQVSYVYPNFKLDYNFFDVVFPQEPGLAEPMGLALLLAKHLTVPLPEQFQVENNDKYNLMGDPSLRPLIPEKQIEFAAGEATKMIAGMKKEISGSIMKGTQVDSTFSGTVHLLVRESDDTTGYTRESDGFFIYYRYPGGVIYKGTADAASGHFSFGFHLPRYPHPGSHAYMMAYAENGVRDASATEKNVHLVYPSVPDTSLPEPIDGPPRVELGFKGGVNKVKPGAMLQAVVRDADGINILSTTNEGKQALLFDDSNLPIDVTQYFSFDHGGTDTAGVLLYPLPDISVGNHSAIYKVGDSFGQLSLDTLSFSVIDPLANYAEAVLNYPNPFTSSTYFLFHLSQRAVIKLDIYTTSGRRIRSLNATRDEGEAWIYWDGRDAAMDDIANGVYLFVAKVSFIGDDSPPKILRGKLMKIK